MIVLTWYVDEVEKARYGSTISVFFDMDEVKDFVKNKIKQGNFHMDRCYVVSGKELSTADIRDEALVELRHA